MCVCTRYIEEIVGGHLEKIKDSNLHASLTNFCYENNLLEISVPTPRKLY